MYKVELYSKNSEMQEEIVTFSLSKYGKFLKIPDFASVLEVGIGGGEVTESVLFTRFPKYVQYVGSDVSMEAIECSKKRESFKNKELVLLDITTDNLSDDFKGRFDVVVSFNTFQCLTREGIRKALKNIYDMLKSSGIVYFIFYEWTPADEPFVEMSKKPKWAKYGNHLYCSPFYQTDEEILEYYEKTMPDVGFENTKCYRDIFHTKKDQVLFENCLISVNRAIKDVCEEDKKDYIKEYLECALNQECVKLSCDSDSAIKPSIFVTFPIITINAEK